MTTQTVQKSSVGNTQPQFDLRMTDEQEEYLERQFGKMKNPHPSEIILIAAESGLTDQDVKIWFDRRMACWRRDQGLSPFRNRLY